MSATDNVPAQRVPAWKRLGLKLKQPGSSPQPTPSSVGQQQSGRMDTQQSPAASMTGKRKIDAAPLATSSAMAAGPKRPRTDGQTVVGGSLPEKSSSSSHSKSVSFGDTPTRNGHHPASTRAKSANKQTTPAKKSKGPPKKQAPVKPTDVKPALEYLRLWKSSRDSWKFNKNHQSLLIKHALEPSIIPAANIDTFYDYIGDLKGFVRVRLCEAAMEVRKQDQAIGSRGFPQGTVDLDAKQANYESILSKFLLPQSPVGSKRKLYNEADFLSTSPEVDVILQRIVKRMRAELILDELSDSGETEATNTTSTSETMVADDEGSGAVAASAAEVGKKLKLNDGTSKRRRKVRTANLDDSSSSESESESDSDTSSSESSSDSEDDDDDDGDDDEDDDDEDVARGSHEGGDDYGDIGSSSSSSSSEDESDSDDDSDEEL